MIGVALDMVGVCKMASYSDCDGGCDSICGGVVCGGCLRRCDNDDGCDNKAGGEACGGCCYECVFLIQMSKIIVIS